jgi:hypothetical protein
MDNDPFTDKLVFPPILSRFKSKPGLPVEVVGTYRLIVAGTPFFSIINQENFTAARDIIVEITHTMFGSQAVFVKPMELNQAFFLGKPGLVRRGSDEYTIAYAATQPYVLPEPTIQFIHYTFGPKKDTP